MILTLRTSALVASSLMLGAASAHAVTFDFNSDSQFTTNFEAYAVPNGSFAQSASSGKVTWTTGGGQTGAFVYDANGSAGGVTNLLPGSGNSVVVDFDFSTSVSNVGFGVFFGGTRSSEYLALFNINNNGSTDQLRVFNVQNWNATTPATVGATTTAANASTTTLTNGWTASATYHAKFTMTYTSATTADVTYLITDPLSSVSSFSITATNLAVSGVANEIGFRLGSGNSAAILSIDNLSIIATSAIPEPSAFAAFAGLATLGFAASRRRRSRA